MKISKLLHTNGSGYWSAEKKAVRIEALELSVFLSEYHGIPKDFGELKVYFRISGKNSWQVNENGLIYTDNLFLKELREVLNQLGLKGEDCSYSEQGMQGDDYVSCDVGQEFIDSWRKMKRKFYAIS